MTEYLGWTKRKILMKKPPPGGGRLGCHSSLREAGRKPFLMIADADLQSSRQHDHHAVLGVARLDQGFVPCQLFDDGKA